MNPNRADLSDYFDMVFGYADPGEENFAYSIVLRGLGEKGTDGEGVFNEAEVLPPVTDGTVDAVLAHVTRWSAHHRASFIVPALVAPSALSDKKATEERILQFTTLVVDIDKGDTAGRLAHAVKYMGVPSMVVESGGVTYASTGRPLGRFLDRVLGRRANGGASLPFANAPRGGLVCPDGTCPLIGGGPQTPMVTTPATPPVVYRRLTTLMAEEAQVDWGAFGSVRIGHGVRPLSGFVMVLSYSRALFALFTLDQTLESFLRGHVEAFAALGGVPRTILYDNLKSVVLDRVGDHIRFHPRVLELKKAHSEADFVRAFEAKSRLGKLLG